MDRDGKMGRYERGEIEWDTKRKKRGKYGRFWDWNVVREGGGG